MNPFMTFERLGDVAELTYETIYTGCGNEFGICVLRLIHIFEKLVDAGMITNMTKKKIEKFLTRDMSLSNMQIISKHTNDVVLVNTEIHELDSFDLRQFITWITEQLCRDPIMKKKLGGRNTYEGVKRIINSCVNKECQPLTKEKWIDFYICKDRVFYTRKDETGIHLYVKKKCARSPLFFKKLEKDEEMQLVKENLLDGSIYHFIDETVFVNAACGYIVQISNVGDGRYYYSKMDGWIMNQLEDGGLLFVENGKLVRLKPNGKQKKLVDNVFLGITGIDGKQVIWKSRLRKKDFELGNIGEFNDLTREQIIYCLNNSRVSKEMLWKGLLFTLYDFKHMNFDNRIGNRCKFAEFFDMLPVPFSLQEIVNKLSKIERSCYDGDVIKTDGYIEAMGYLVSLEGEQLDERRTMSALAYLLDNVTINPYERIVDSSGWGIINCIDFFFDETEEKDEMHFEEEDELKMILGDAVDNMSAEQFNGKIDSIIAELHKQIEEEEQKEKEARRKEESGKERNKKNSRGDKIERKLPGDEAEKVGRSAEAIDLPGNK